MIIKQKHKIVNLIIMIVMVFVGLFAFNYSYAEDDDQLGTDEAKKNKSVYSAQNDYTVTEETDIKDAGKSDSMWTSINTNSFFQEVRLNVAKWYYLLRYIAIAVMLVLLIVLAIKLALASMAPKKALYKRMLVDWLACFALVFLSHYFMIFIQFINENVISIVSDVSNILNTDGKYDLYETVRSRAYDIKFTVGFSGMILYITLLYFTVKYIYIYAKRFILVLILTIIAPISTLLYSIQKILTGKSKLLSKWMEEYAVNVLLQCIHAITYAVFVGTALKLTETSLFGIILSLIFLNFMSKADGMFRRIFKFSNGSSMADEIANSQVSELKDNISSAVSAAIIARQTGVAKAARNATAKALRPAATVLAKSASNFKDSNMFKDYQKSREEQSKKKLENYNKNIDEAKKEREKLEKQYNDNKDSMGDKDKKKLENAVEKAKDKERQQLTKKQRYNFRKGLFERIRDALDPDNYLEYDDDNFDYVTYDKDELDANGNVLHHKGDKVLTPDGDELIIRKRRLLKSEKIYNAETNEFVRIGGVRNKFNKKKDNILGLTEQHKALIKEAKQMINDGVLGFGSLLLGMGTFVDNPTLGFSMLAIGGSKMNRLVKQDEGVKMDGRTKRTIKRIMKRKTKEYKHAQFTTGSILSIDEAIKELTRTDIDEDSINNIIWKIKTNNLSYFIPSLPFTLTGTRGALFNCLKLVKKMAKQHLEDIKTYERSVDVELSKSISKKIIDKYQKFLQGSSKHIIDRETIDIAEEIRIDDGTIVTTEDNITFVFDSQENQDVLSTKSRMRKAIIDTALSNNIYDLNDLDFENEKLKKDLINNLVKQGLLDEKDKNRYYKVQKLLNGTVGDEGQRGTMISSYINGNPATSTDKINRANEISDQLGVNGILSILAQEEPDVLKRKVFEKIITDYIRTHKDEIKSKKDLLRVKSKLTSIYQKELRKDPMKKKLISIVSNQNIDLSKVTYDDVISYASQSDIDLFKRTILSRTRTDSNSTIKKVSDIDKVTFEKHLNAQMNELNGTLDNIILNTLVNHGISQAISVDLNDSSSAQMQSIRSDIITLLKLSGIDNNVDELISMAQTRLNSITDEEIENAMISKVVSEFIADKCGGDSSKIQTDSDLKQELEQLVMDKYKELNNKAELEQQKSTDNIIELLKNMKSNDNNNQSNNQNAQYEFSFDKVEDDTDSDLDLTIPLPIVKSELVNDIMICTFSIPSGYNDLKIETAIVTEGAQNYSFIENIDVVNIENNNNFILARLSRNGKHGPILKINYPEDPINIVEKIQESVKSSKDKEDAESISGDVFDSLFVYDENATQDEVLGSDTIEASQDDDISRLFKTTRVVRSNNKFQNVISEIQSMKSGVAKDTDRDKTNQTIKDAILDIDYEVGGRESFDSDDSFDEHRDATVDLLRSLLEMKAVDEDADSLKMKKDAKNNKKYKKAKLELSENLQKIDVQDVINSIYSII